MTTNNILHFPKDKIVRDNSLNFEEFQQMKEKSKQKFADTLVHDMSESLLSDFDEYGFNVESEDFSKDFHYLILVLSALIYRSLEIKHDLHPFLDENVTIKFINPDETVDLTD